MTNLSQNSRFLALCSLYEQYKNAVHVIKSYDMLHNITDINTNEVNYIFQEIEKFPIAWKFYKQQKFKFSSDFEDLIIFSDD